MKEKILVLAYPGIGKTYTVSNYQNVIDFEQQHYTYIYDEDIKDLPLEQIKNMPSKRQPNPDWPNNFIADIKPQLEKDKVVITTFISKVYQALCEIAKLQQQGVRVILVMFDKNNFEELANRFRERGSNELFIERRQEDFNEVTKLFENAEGVEKIVLSSGQYLADALIDHGLQLKPGQGQKNYK